MINPESCMLKREISEISNGAFNLMTTGEGGGANSMSEIINVEDDNFGMSMPLSMHHSTYWTLEYMDENINFALAEDSNSEPQSRSNSAPATITKSPSISDSASAGSNPDSWSTSSASASESGERICANCHTTQTPFWRRAKEGHFYCNACGLYHRAHGTMRPVALQKQAKKLRARQDICSNCRVKDTPLWRRLVSGETVCNACGLYYKLHGAHRPMGEECKLPGVLLTKRPRILLPKHVNGGLWHHYLPPNSCTRSGIREKGDLQHLRMINSLSLSKRTFEEPLHHHHHLTSDHITLSPDNGLEYLQLSALAESSTGAFNMVSSFTNINTTNPSPSLMNLRGGGGAGAGIPLPSRLLSNRERKRKVMDSLDDPLLRWFSHTTASLDENPFRSQF